MLILGCAAPEVGRVFCFVAGNCSVKKGSRKAVSNWGSEGGVPIHKSGGVGGGGGGQMRFLGDAIIAFFRSSEGFMTPQNVKTTVLVAGEFESSCLGATFEVLIG